MTRCIWTRRAGDRERYARARKIQVIARHEQMRKMGSGMSMDLSTCPTSFCATGAIAWNQVVRRMYSLHSGGALQGHRPEW